MKNLASFLLLIVLVVSSAFSPSADKAFKWYNGEGKEMDTEEVMKAMLDADIVFFGEQHNNPHAHWFELRFLQYLYEKKGDKLVAGAEMFERDNQVSIDEYLSGMINDKKLEENTRVWNNYQTDYKPLLQYAKEKHIPFIGTNIPRRYASMVFSGGFDALDSLSPEAYTFLPTLPILYDTTVSCYADLLHNPMMGHGGPNLVKAQAIKDATMAHFILTNYKKGQLFYHVNGAYHSNKAEGIAWYLKKANPGLKIFVISNADQADIGSLDDENKGLGNAILVTDETFPKSY